eukprot:scaffold46411_cov68-Phaeocystis_antarctica.AAC.7
MPHTRSRAPSPPGLASSCATASGSRKVVPFLAVTELGGRTSAGAEPCMPGSSLPQHVAAGAAAGAAFGGLAGLASRIMRCAILFFSNRLSFATAWRVRTSSAGSAQYGRWREAPSSRVSAASSAASSEMHDAAGHTADLSGHASLSTGCGRNEPRSGRSSVGRLAVPRSTGSPAN